MPADIVAQSIEDLRVKLKAWVRILAIVRFFISSVAFLLQFNAGEALGIQCRQRLHNFIMLIKKQT